jgi:hypothetical protein
MGIDTGKLKDILMMDMLPTSIGILTWTHAAPVNGSNGGSDSAKKKATGVSSNGTSTSCSEKSVGGGGGQPASKDAYTEEDTRYFEPVLHKGDRIPARGKKTFQLADPNQKYVSLDIYEEFEEYRNNTTTTTEERRERRNSIEHLGDAGRTTTGKQRQEYDEDSRYHYQLIATYDFPVPREARINARGKLPQVDVVFTMSPDGHLSFSVNTHDEATEKGNPGNDPSARPSHGSEDAADEMSVRSIMLLGVYLAIMIALYIVVKTAILTPETQELMKKFSDSTEQGNPQTKV